MYVSMSVHENQKWERQRRREGERFRASGGQSKAFGNGSIIDMFVGRYKIYVYRNLITLHHKIKSNILLEEPFHSNSNKVH